MKILDRFFSWIWHIVFEKSGGLPCNKCIEKWKADNARTNPANMNEPLKQIETTKKRYGCPQDYTNTKDFIGSL
jgi:hypothetical protein